MVNSKEYLQLRLEPVSAPDNTVVKTKFELVDANEFVKMLENTSQELQDQMLLAQAE